MTPLRFSDVRVGQTKSRKYPLTKKVYEDFLAVFKDTNPLHIDDAYAKKKGFKSRLMHGAILNGFLSHFIGMVFPGKHSLLQSVNIKYRGPVYLGETLVLRCRVEHKSEATRTLSLDIDFLRAGAGKSIATAKVQVGVLA